MGITLYKHDAHNVNAVINSTYVLPLYCALQYY